MDEVTKTEGSTTINQYPNNNGWGGPGWGGYGYPAYGAVPMVPAYGNYGFGGGLDGLMRGFGGNINFGGGRGLAATGTALGATALGLVGLGILARNGGLFGGPGGNGGPHCDFVTQRELGLVRENGTLAAENGQLKAQIYTDNKTDAVIKTLVEWRQRQELIDNTAAAEIAALKQENANMKAQLGSMLGTYITPNVMLPSQAVATQIAATKTTTASGS